MFLLLCVAQTLRLEGAKYIYIWQDAVNYYMLVVNIHNDTPKIIDN